MLASVFQRPGSRRLRPRTWKSVPHPRQLKCICPIIRRGNTPVTSSWFHSLVASLPALRSPALRTTVEFECLQAPAYGLKQSPCVASSAIVIVIIEDVGHATPTYELPLGLTQDICCRNGSFARPSSAQRSFLGTGAVRGISFSSTEVSPNAQRAHPGRWLQNVPQAILALGRTGRRRECSTSNAPMSFPRWLPQVYRVFLISRNVSLP